MARSTLPNLDLDHSRDRSCSDWYLAPEGATRRDSDRVAGGAALRASMVCSSLSDPGTSRNRVFRNRHFAPDVFAGAQRDNASGEHAAAGNEVQTFAPRICLRHRGIQLDRLRPWSVVGGTIAP